MPLRDITRAGSTPTAMTSQAMDYSTRYEVPSSRAGLKFNPKAISYSHNLHGTIESVTTSFLVGWYCSIQFQYWSKPLMFLLPQHLARHLLTLWKLARIEKVWDCFFLKCSSAKMHGTLATESYHAVLRGNKRNNLCCLEDLSVQ